MTACGKSQTQYPSFKKNDAVLATVDGTGVPGVTPAAELPAAKASNGMELFFDGSADCVCVREQETGFVWSALPPDGAVPSYSFIVTVAGELGRYYLNSRDHAAAFGGIAAAQSDAGIQVSYVFSDRAEIAQKQTDDLLAGELQVRFTVLYALADGKLTVRIDAASIFVSAGFVLEKLSVLPFFDAISYFADADSAAVSVPEAQTETNDENPREETEIVSTSGQDAFSDFILMPDGCGAAVYTRFTDPANADLTFRVSPQAGDGVHTASLGVFGIKSGEKAFACTVTGGLAVADIRSVQIAAGSERVCTAYAEFRITQTQTSGELYYYGLPYNGEISLVYEFLSGRRASYIAMADAARETMVRAGLLRETRLSADGVPLAVSLLCSLNGKRANADFTFRQAEDLLNQLKAKGVNAAEIVLHGAFEGGMLQNDDDRLRAASALGGESAFSSLCEYAHRQNYRIFAGMNLLYAEEDAAVKKLNGDKARILVPLGAFASEWRENLPASAALLSATGIEKNAVKILKRLRDGALDSVCLNDVAATHYYDAFAKKNVSEVSTLVRAQLGALVGAGGLAVRGANAAMLREAELFLDIPFETAVAASDSYVPVPLLPAVLHGSAFYTGASFNTGAAPLLSLLKCAEYGGIPYYAWSSRASSPLYYSNGLSQAVEYAAKLNALLGDLTDVRISDHRKLANGVFRTDYENGVVIFVNYNHYSVNIGGITLPPYDYLRMN